MKYFVVFRSERTMERHDRLIFWTFRCLPTPEFDQFKTDGDGANSISHTLQILPPFQRITWGFIFLLRLRERLQQNWILDSEIKPMLTVNDIQDISNGPLFGPWRCGHEVSSGEKSSPSSFWPLLKTLVSLSVPWFVGFLVSATVTFWVELEKKYHTAVKKALRIERREILHMNNGLQQAYFQNIKFQRWMLTETTHARAHQCIIIR